LRKKKQAKTTARRDDMIRSILGIMACAAVVVLTTEAARAEAIDPASSPFAAAGKQYTEAYNRKDAAAVAALFADDAVRVTDRGIIQGRDAIQKSTEAALEAGGHDLRIRYHVAHIDGNTGWSVAEVDYSVRGKDGSVSPMHAFGTSVWVRDGGAWKIKTSAITNAPPPKQ
jgi:uncharacterized protein (TIGR02246 family)